jgi:hypothetical protein
MVMTGGWFMKLFYPHTVRGKPPRIFMGHEWNLNGFLGFLSDPILLDYNFITILLDYLGVINLG